jgi:hypothetical protein
MMKKKRFLAASILELLRYFVIGAMAPAIGLDAAGKAGEALFRYALLPQLLFAAGFFFLWLDGERYARYRTLLLVGKVGLILPGALFSFSIHLGARSGAGVFGIPGAAPQASLALVFADLFGLLCLILPGNPKVDEVTRSDSSIKEPQ